MTTPETNLNIAIAQYLRMYQYSATTPEIFYERLYGGGIPRAGGRSVFFMKREVAESLGYRHKGKPDWRIDQRKGDVVRHIYIEGKSATGEQRKNQIIMQKILEYFGHEYYIVRNLDDLIEVLK